MTTDSSFIQFRDGMGGRLIERAWNLQIYSLNSWREFRSQIINENLDSDGAFFQQAREAEGWLSCGERAVMLATLYAVGFDGFAEELNGGCSIQMEEDISHNHREAFRLAMSVATV
ncbi:MAG: hypothetical protein HOL04_00130 [Gammaproteobacteria bacterium]|nr:hypothetical protein [Gammaproteobacteria bacterium]MBT4607486.1 hypothetical protein [Thiotrichales bacterium]MBT3472159.1 hypothetical protein [Gammaproteobacteria bacterium]MBT3967282.1 hypothetical protein [Gammaproteobacteria bacterium]MBT4082070.1 hypothetical protein [Gammaproteobacteria bacterium]